MKTSPELYTGIYQALSDEARSMLVYGYKLSGRPEFRLRLFPSAPEIRICRGLIALGLLTSSPFDPNDEGKIVKSMEVNLEEHYYLFTRLGYEFTQGLIGSGVDNHA